MAKENVGNIQSKRLEDGKVEETILRTTKSPGDLDVVINSTSTQGIHVLSPGFP